MDMIKLQNQSNWLLEILGYNFDEFLAWVGEDTDTLMMLIWILPVIIFVFYGQRIQLMISSNEIVTLINALGLDPKAEEIDLEDLRYGKIIIEFSNFWKRIMYYQL